MALANYPSFADLSAEDLLLCHWEGCRAKRPFKNLTTLEKHIKQVHGVQAADMKHHWIHTEGLRALLPPSVMSEKEVANVGLAFDDDDRVLVESEWKCIKCDKTFKKAVSSIAKHFARPPHDDIDQGELKHWLVYKDAVTLQNTANEDYHLKHLRLTKAIKAREWGRLPAPAGDAALADAAGEAELDDLAEVADAPPPPPTPAPHEVRLPALAVPQARPKPMPNPAPAATQGRAGEPEDPVLGMLQKIHSSLQGRKEIEVNLPRVEPKQFLFEWAHPPAAQYRANCPIPSKESEAFDRFDFEEGCRGAGMQGCKGAGVQGCRGAGVPPLPPPHSPPPPPPTP